MSRKVLIGHKSAMGWIFGALLILLVACTVAPGLPKTEITQNRLPTATADRLAEPVLPVEPTQYEQGRHLYWLNCMPCHGDTGQGLTDEFRSLWEDDHQDCWARGCHAGHPSDQGFPLPHTIPAIISSSGNLPPYATAEELFDYLRATHPLQHPGYLPEAEYWAITAYLLTENGRLPPGQEVGPDAAPPLPETISKLAILGLPLLIGGLIVVWSLARRRSRQLSDPGQT